MRSHTTVESKRLGQESNEKKSAAIVGPTLTLVLSAYVLNHGHA